MYICECICHIAMNHWLSVRFVRLCRLTGAEHGRSSGSWMTRYPVLELRIQQTVIITDRIDNHGRSISIEHVMYIFITKSIHTTDIGTAAR